jgi:hypothetical protein
MFLEKVYQILMLAQTAQEKKITRFGLIFLGLFVGVLLLDAFSKGKLISTKGKLKKILLVVFVLIFAVLFIMKTFYK